MTSVSEVRVAIATELEGGFIEAKRSAEEESFKWEGAIRAYKTATQAMDEMQAHIARDLKEGEFGPDEAKIAQLYAKRCAAICANLRLKAEVNHQRALGRADAFVIASKATSKMVASANRNLADPEHQETPVELPPSSPPRDRIAELMARNNPQPVAPAPAPKKVAKKRAPRASKKATKKKATKKKATKA